MVLFSAAPDGRCQTALTSNLEGAPAHRPYLAHRLAADRQALKHSGCLASTPSPPGDFHNLDRISDSFRRARDRCFRCAYEFSRRGKRDVDTCAK